MWDRKLAFLSREQPSLFVKRKRGRDVTLNKDWQMAKMTKTRNIVFLWRVLLVNTNSSRQSIFSQPTWDTSANSVSAFEIHFLFFQSFIWSAVFVYPSFPWVFTTNLDTMPFFSSCVSVWLETWGFPRKGSCDEIISFSVKNKKFESLHRISNYT